MGTLEETVAGWMKATEVARLKDKVTAKLTSEMSRTDDPSAIDLDHIVRTAQNACATDYYRAHARAAKRLGDPKDVAVAIHARLENVWQEIEPDIRALMETGIEPAVVNQGQLMLYVEKLLRDYHADSRMFARAENMVKDAEQIGLDSVKEAITKHFVPHYFALVRDQLDQDAHVQLRNADAIKDIYPAVQKAVERVWKSIKVKVEAAILTQDDMREAALQTKQEDTTLLDSYTDGEERHGGQGSTPTDL